MHTPRRRTRPLCLALALLGYVTLILLEPLGDVGIHRFLTWEVPGFAYFNNQLVLHIASEAFRLGGRDVVHPPLRFPPRGSLPELYLNMSQLYDLPTTDYAPRAPPTDVAKLPIRSLSEYVRITNKHEAFWAHMYTRFLVVNFVLGFTSATREAASKFVYKQGGLIDTCLQTALQQYPIQSSIGIHLRSWSKDVSLVNSHECDRIYKSSPLKLLWKCRTDTSTLRSMIDWVRRDNEAIVVATDDVTNDVLRDLRQAYPVVHTVNYTALLAQCSAPGILSPEWMRAHGVPILESELMVRSKVFIGNAFSTFSNVIAVRRPADASSYFVQTTPQYLAHHFLWMWIALDLVDPVHSNLNAGGLYGERNGWHLPGYPDKHWALAHVLCVGNSTLRDLVPDLVIPSDHVVSLALTIRDPNRPQTAGNYRALILVNGWQLGQYIAQVGPQHTFVLMSGILLTNGSNSLAIAVTSNGGSGDGLEAVQLVSLGAVRGGVPVSNVRSPSYQQLFGRRFTVQQRD
ncbi:hypothetical protein RI367_007879 [Sorochytrium milnesiophthora]